MSEANMVDFCLWPTPQSCITILGNIRTGAMTRANEKPYYYSLRLRYKTSDVYYSDGHHKGVGIVLQDMRCMLQTPSTYLLYNTSLS